MTSHQTSPTTADTLRELLAAAQCVLFDFDGPITAVFGGHEAQVVAAALDSRIASWPRAPELTDRTDPMQILLDVAVAFDGSEHDHRVAELDKLLADQEAIAVASARPTPYADSLVRRLVARGTSVAVTTNNSAAAVLSYLELRGLAVCFGPHVHGRAADPLLMKPHPSCVREAIRSTGVSAGQCLMIGDSPRDYQASSAAGVAFLGYAKNDRKQRQLAEAGVEYMVDSLADVYEAADAGQH
ncbi:HAD family hydrolase [Actinacidiphila bryophytorum]|uniref:Haloacid dehalogenase superfamily, subfamily IA, variant 3 with third motif having DD or ED n=1 Tax=Actinacidiphila bryophytorum TaxID=1436133 RepID=A0A9W4GY42_9ACTN|nr:HAD family hydrolase [Actinacidiphila bryophytorum]MBM9438947.1 HAD family hydrolase [Actinacidiphila bryophytorum]MBN6547737.1 HAD family hydrolase [Actinacidiphila bryophytorum]CAG7616409.1 Haloacid dehalogenase superfamily, subfamily IA, variant 3 with third motif having DD or ED [Actinacidiphila bryophytorum]